MSTLVPRPEPHERCDKERIIAKKEVVSAEELETWRECYSPLLEIACALTRYAPRGKGYLARMLGRTLARRSHMIMRTACGAKLAIDALNLDAYTTMRVRHEVSEPDVLQGCFSVLNPGDVLYDIGANAGYVGLELSTILRGDLFVTAFEPIPSLAHAAAVSAALNGYSKMSVISALIGNYEGEAELWIGSHAIHASRIARQQRSRVVRRPIMTIDGLVARGETPPPQVVKMDVEGGELDVFRGAVDTLQKLRPFLVFESDANMQRYGYGRADLIRFLHEVASYRCFGIGADAFVPESHDGFMSVLSNVLAVPPGVPDPVVRRFDTA